MRTEFEGNVFQAAAVAGSTPMVSGRARPIRVPLLTSGGLGESLREKLLDQGFAVQVLDHESLRSPAAIDADADIVVIDQSVPRWSSLDAMAQLRGQGINAPVVLINGPPAPAKQADYGSDVIHGAPGVPELAQALRLAATFAATSEAKPADERVTCGDLVLHPVSRRAFWKGVDLDLTIGEYRIVDLLASRPGQHCTYRAIYDRLRHEGFVAGEGPRGYWANVRSAIKRLRNKFRTLDSSFDEIENYIGFGYRWRKPD